MNVEFTNNFNSFKEDFKKDTGLDAKTNLETYISYYQARTQDKSMQIQWHILHYALNIFDIKAKEYMSPKQGRG